MKGTNVILKGRKSDNYGYLKISYRESGKTRIISLGLKVKKTDFNKRNQRVRQSNPNADEINRIIEEKLSSLRLLPYQKHKINSLLCYMRTVIERTIVLSTKQKYENIHNLFLKFLLSETSKDDIRFEDIDSIIISHFYKWLCDRNKTNTANYKMKSFKSFFSKAQKEGVYIYQISPFISLQMKRMEDTKKEHLSLNELRRLIGNEYLPEFRTGRPSFIKINLQDVLDSFIFSTLSQGLRISDILTLRFNDFTKLEGHSINTNDYKILIKKKIIKTKNTVLININLNISRYLERQVDRIIRNHLPYLLDYDDYQLFTSHRENRYLLKKELDKKIESLKTDDQEFEFPPSDNDEQKSVRKKYENMFEQNEHMVYFYFVSLLQYILSSSKTNTRFVFPFLDDNLFNNISGDNDFSQMTEKQFLQFQGKRGYINLLLKTILKQKGIDKRLSFHSSRHTYTSLTLENNENGLTLYDLQKALGHSSVLSTEKYIQGFNTERLKQMTDNLIKKLF